ncbi:hypothetical protein TruAng_011692 [Truncatella angustata]|nr:hypothetical protein TruAng_011692 [Truncatella angustata]
MFARMTTRQARLLRRIVTRQNCLRGSSIQTPNIAHSAAFSTTRSQNAVPRKVPGTFAKARFSKMEVPQLAFWKSMARPPLVVDTEPDEFFRTTHVYVDLAVADKAGWRITLKDPPHSLSYATLHYAAAMIMNGPVGPAYQIALHIYHTLVTLNYPPSIITVIRLAFMRNKLGQPQFSLAEEKFAALLRRKDDPNACAMQGIILASKLTPETDKQALQWFRTAASLGGEEPGAWDWQASCAMEMGKVYLRMNNTNKANEIWKYCAERLDVAEGAWLYSTLLDHSDPKKYYWVCRAAVSGIQDAAREMARLEGSRTEIEGVGGAGAWDAKSAGVLQREWEAIAGDRALV